MQSTDKTSAYSDATHKVLQCCSTVVPINGEKMHAYPLAPPSGSMRCETSWATVAPVDIDIIIDICQVASFATAARPERVARMLRMQARRAIEMVDSVSYSQYVAFSCLDCRSKRSGSYGITCPGLSCTCCGSSCSHLPWRPQPSELLQQKRMVREQPDGPRSQSGCVRNLLQGSVDISSQAACHRCSDDFQRKHSS